MGKPCYVTIKKCSHYKGIKNDIQKGISFLINRRIKDTIKIYKIISERVTYVVQKVRKTIL